MQPTATTTAAASLPLLPPPARSQVPCHVFADPHVGPAPSPQAFAATAVAAPRGGGGLAASRAPLTVHATQGAAADVYTDYDLRSVTSSEAQLPAAPRTSPLWDSAAAIAALPAAVLAPPCAAATKTTARRHLRLDESSTASHHTEEDSNDVSADTYADDSTSVSANSEEAATPPPTTPVEETVAAPTTYPGFTPLYRRVPMTRAQAYARLAELQLGKLVHLPRLRSNAANKQQQQQQQRPAPIAEPQQRQQRGSARLRPHRHPSPTAEEIAKAITPVSRSTFRRPPPLPAPSDRTPQVNTAQ